MTKLFIHHMPLNLKLVIADVIYTVKVSGFLTFCLTQMHLNNTSVNRAFDRLENTYFIALMTNKKGHIHLQVQRVIACQFSVQ